MSDKNIKSIIKFGTDGWRGVISADFTFENVAIVARAISHWINHDLKAIEGCKCVAIGYDCRFLSKEYADTVAGVLAKNNIRVILSKEPLPTPALSYGVVKAKGVCGIMITASHNPYQFNGIKIKTAQGGGAGKDITNKVEAYLENQPVKSMDVARGIVAKSIVMHDFKVAYYKFMRNYLDMKRVKSSRFHVIQDVMHGSGGQTLKKVLKGTSLEVSLLRDEVNPYFDGGKPEPIEEYVPDLIKEMKSRKYDLGLVLDGDADRIAAVAPGGEFINPQKILALISLHLIRNRGRKGGLVMTICGSNIMTHIARKLGVKLYETPVGFKYISELMVTEQIVAGGEEAGGMGVQDYIPERDGTLAGLLLVEMMVYQKKNIKQILDEVEKEFGRYYYLRGEAGIGGKFNHKKLCALKTLLGKKVVEVKDYDGVKLICEDESWLMWRPSGTEPLVRIYSEARSLKRSQALLNYGKDAL